MTKLEIKYSTAQVIDPKVPSTEGITIDPYYASVAGSGFTKLGGFVDKIIKDTRVQNDKNKIRKLKIPVDEKIRVEYAKYGTSSDTADVKTFLTNTDFSKFKNDFKRENKYVKNGMESYILGLQKDLHWQLLSEITGRHVAESELGDQEDLDKITLNMAANDVITRTKAYKNFENWFKDSTNSGRYEKIKLKKLYDTKKSQAKRYQLEFGIRNDPFSILRDPQKLTDLDNELAAAQLFKDAKVAAVNLVTNRDWDNLQLEEASISEKINNFSEIVTRMNLWKGNEKEWRSQLPTIDDLHDMFEKDQINSSQYAVLLDFYTNPNKVSNQSVKDMINAQISMASTTEDIDNIEKMVNFDHSIASQLNIKEISKYRIQFEKYKLDFPAAQEAKIFEEKVSTMMGKVSSLGGVFSRDKKMSIEEKELRDLAEDYYNDLVNEKKVIPSDAYVQTVEKFTTEATMPVIYNVANLTSIKLPVPKANELDEKKYFEDRRNEVAKAYKNKQIDIQIYMEDLAALDVIEDVFKVRLELFETKDDDALKFAFGTKTGKALTKKQLGID